MPRDYRAKSGGTIIDRGSETGAPGANAFDGVNVVNGAELMTETGSLRFVVGLKALASSYDANGNMTLRLKDGAHYFLAYDAENRLTSVSGTVSTNFTYNGDGQRVTATIGTAAITTYIGGYYEWKDGVGTSYYFAGAQRVAIRASAGVEFLLGDHLGSTSLTVDSLGGNPRELRYYPWGEVRWASGTTPTEYRFTGQIEVASIGLYDYGARFYDPSLGRFVSPDTIIPQSQGTEAFDRYAYANNSPTKYTDPSGHGAYCGDDYDPGCLSDEEMYYYYKLIRYRTVQVDLYTHDSPNQYDSSIVDDPAYGFNACSIVAGCAAGASFDEMGMAVRNHNYAPNSGIQPSDYEKALLDVYRSEHVDAGEMTLSEVTEALDQEAVVIVDILIQSGENDVAHFARVLGIDWGSSEIYIENTLGDDISYLTVSLDQFETMWLDPENRASHPAPNAEPVNNWAVFIYKITKVR